MVICLERGADLHIAQLMPLPLAVSCFSKIQIGFTFLVPAHLGSPGQRAVKRVCVCVCVYCIFSGEDRVERAVFTRGRSMCGCERPLSWSRSAVCLHGQLHRRRQPMPYVNQRTDLQNITRQSCDYYTQWLKW